MSNLKKPQNLALVSEDDDDHDYDDDDNYGDHDASIIMMHR